MCERVLTNYYHLQSRPIRPPIFLQPILYYSFHQQIENGKMRVIKSQNHRETILLFDIIM